MLRRAAFSLCCSVSYMWASSAVLVADKMTADESNVSAKGNAVAVGKGYFVRADELEYSETNKTLRATGSVMMLKDSSLFSTCEEARFFIDKNESYLEKVFLSSSVENLWTKAENADSKQYLYNLNGAVSSSCNTEKPEWYIKYAKGVYDSEQKRLSLQDATLVIYDVPLLYTPYFSFSTDKTRRTGLLTPDIGVKSNEGFVYTQPFYYVSNPQSNWDLESTPQLRTKRGIGMNETLRFVDSAYSYGNLKAGYFSDFDSYNKEYRLKNSSHFGGSFLYDRQKVFADESNATAKSFTDGLYANLNYLNDIDYINLQNYKAGRTLVLDKIATSKLNYYAKQGGDYVGVYFKYFIDASKTSNDDTLQELPRVQYHRAFSSFLFDDLRYSVDARASRYDRKSGLNAMQYEASMPIGYYGSLFGDYLGWALQENFYVNRVRFDNSGGVNYDNYQFSNSSHKLKLFSSLVSPYEEVIHHVDVEAVYTKPGFKSEKNYPLLKNELTNLVTSSDEKENAQVRLAQFLYNSKGDMILSHRLSQTYNVDMSRAAYKYEDMRNELLIKLGSGFEFNTDTAYSFKYSKLSAATSSISYLDPKWQGRVSHVFKDKAGILGDDKGSFLAFDGSYKFDFVHFIFANYEFDAYKKETRSWGLGFGMKKRCFSYEIALKNEVIPMLTDSNLNSIRSYSVYFRINLFPIGGLNQMYSLWQH